MAGGQSLVNPICRRSRQLMACRSKRSPRPSSADVGNVMFHCETLKSFHISCDGQSAQRCCAPSLKSPHVAPEKNKKHFCKHRTLRGDSVHKVHVVWLMQHARGGFTPAPLTRRTTHTTGTSRQHPGVLVTEVGYFAVKSAKVDPGPNWDIICMLIC